MYIRQAVKKKEVEDEKLPKYPSYEEFLELKKVVKKLLSQKEPKKLSALNKFKKEIISPITEQALADTEYVDLIPVDKMRLFNKAYPIIWETLVLKPIYKKYDCEDDEEEQQKLREKKNIQFEYNLQVDSIIEQMNAGELDDQEHYKEDLASLFTDALNEAASTFKKTEDEDDSDYDYDEDED